MFRKLLLLFLVWVVHILAHTNALIDEESPYLRQHAHNPVDWLPWGEEAFAKAKRENKPIFLSIGYSTCHWCHVMERESFENEEIAKLINRYYVPIKVDKEERPDLDKYYQSVYAVMHRRSGGWPLTIIMTPNRIPYFSATYIPPEDGYGVQGMKTILPKFARLYREHPELVRKRGQAVLRLVDRYLHARFDPVKLDTTLAQKALKKLWQRFDRRYGGFGEGVKFPEAATLDLAMDISLITKDPRAMKIVTKTLDAMAKGGIYDQIEGAFFRYSTARDWSMPHFEKMLYTNAELVRIYTRAYLLTKKPLYKEVVAQTIREIDRRFGYKGLYKSASDADTAGEEGRYFLFVYDEVLEFLLKNGIAKKEAEQALHSLGIMPDGTFDGEFSVPVRKGKVDEKIMRLLRRLRKKVAYPFIDSKIITAWNALYIDAKLYASLIYPEFRDEALRSLDKLLAGMHKEGRLYHQALAGKEPKKAAFLEDYAFLIQALLRAYETTFDTHYLAKASKLLAEAKKRFYKDGVWYFGPGVPADLSDSYYASALATLYHDMLTLALLHEDLALFAFAKKNIDAKSAIIAENPASYPTATRAALRLALGDVVLKGRDIDKYRILIEELHYPYVFAKKAAIQGYMACKIDLCFKEAKDFATIAKSVEALLDKKAKIGWKVHNAR